MSEQPPAPAGKTVRNTGLRALWLGAFALFTALFFYPLGLVLGVAALVVGIRARRSAKAADEKAPGALGGIVLGGIGLTLSAVSVAVTAYLWPELNRYEECLGSANTNADEQACRDEHFPKIEKKLDLPPGSMDRYGDLF